MEVELRLKLEELNT